MWISLFSLFFRAGAKCDDERDFMVFHTYDDSKLNKLVEVAAKVLGRSATSHQDVTQSSALVILVQIKWTSVMFCMVVNTQYTNDRSVNAECLSDWHNK